MYSVVASWTRLEGGTKAFPSFRMRGLCLIVLYTGVALSIVRARWPTIECTHAVQSQRVTPLALCEIACATPAKLKSGWRDTTVWTRTIGKLCCRSMDMSQEHRSKKTAWLLKLPTRP